MAAERIVTAGATEVFLSVIMRDSSTGAFKPSITYDEAMVSYQRDGAATNVAPSMSEGILGIHAANTWKETESAGVYQLCLADAAFAAGARGVVVTVTASGAIDAKLSVALVEVDLQVAGGKLPVTLAAADAAELATAAAQTTMLNRLGAWAGTGLNTVLGALRALASKAAGLTPSDLSSGTTFSNLTDSVEALRDRGGVGAITLGAVQLLNLAENRLASPRTLEMHMGEEKVFVLSFLDAAGQPIDLSERELRFVVHDENDPPTVQFTVESDGITLSGEHNEVASVLVPAEEVDFASSNLDWAFWDVGNKGVLGYGRFGIRATGKDPPEPPP